MVKPARVGEVLWRNLSEMFKQKKNNSVEQEIVDVCIFTEGTYPFVKGGVSSVIHQVIENHPEITFGIVHIAWDKTAPSKNLFPKLANVKWVERILLNNPEKRLDHGPLSRKVLGEFLTQFMKLEQASVEDIKKFYQKFINPLTREVNFQHALTNSKFFDLLINNFIDLEMTLNELYWLQKEYSLLATSLLDKVYPKARVYHSHTNGYAGLAASLAALQNDKNFILTEHSLYIRDVLQEIDQIYSKNTSELGKMRKKVWEKWFKSIGNITYKVAYKNTYLYDKISEDASQLGANSTRSVIIPNGIDYNKFAVAREKQSNREDLRFKPGVTWKLGFIGRIVPVKGVKDLIIAMSMLRHTIKEDFEVHLIGPTEEDAKYYKECLELTEQYQLQGLLHFHGPQDVAKFLEDIDLVVMSSLSEALPVVILESMAAGVPIVSTNVGSVANILVNPLTDENGEVVAEAGQIVPAQEPKLLSDSIVDLLNNKDNYEKYRANGPKRVLHSFQLKQIMNKYGQLYREHL